MERAHTESTAFTYLLFYHILATCFTQLAQRNAALLIDVKVTFSFCDIKCNCLTSRQCRLCSDILETELEGQGITNWMELSAEMNQDLFFVHGMAGMKQILLRKNRRNPKLRLNSTCLKD